MAGTHFATGIGAPEGPVALPDGSMYVVEMTNATLCVTKLDPAGQRSVVRTTGGRPNGLAMDGDGNLWVAEAGLQALICLSPTGEELLRVEGDDEGPFLFPNDIAFGPDGHLYMTDSGMAVRDFLDGQNFVANYRDLPWDGRVYEIDPKTGVVLRRIDRGILFTNGIAFDAEHRLYANETFTGDIFRYDLSGSGTPKREMFGNVIEPDGEASFKGPDGMKFGLDGRLYCTVYGQGNVTVLDHSGTVVDRLRLDGRNPTNCAFAQSGRTLLVTEVGKGQVERIPVPCDGLPLHTPKLGRG